MHCRNLATISQEHPPAYDSQSNGGVEVGVKLIRGFFLTLKLCTEARIDKFNPRGPSGGRLAARAHVPDPERKGQRLRRAHSLGPCTRPSVQPAHAELPREWLLQDAGQGPTGPDGNMGTRWAVGAFLSYSRNSNCYLVGTASGVIPARSLQRRPAEERWRADEVAQVQATPWSLHERPQVEVRFREPAAEQADVPGDTR